MNRNTVLSIVFIALISVWGMLSLLSTTYVLAESTNISIAQTFPYPDQRDAVAHAVGWLIITHQNDDGGYTSFSAGANQAQSDVGGTIEALLAISSAGYSPEVPFPGKDNSPIDFLLQNVNDLAALAAVDGGLAGKVVLALVAANEDPRSFGGTNFINILQNHLLFSGQFNVETAFNQSLAILALNAVNETVPVEAVTWLMDLQEKEGDLAGSWDDGFGTAGNADATAMSIMALASTNFTVTNESLSIAVDFLNKTQLESGGWEYGAGFGENVSSTALVVQALSAVGEDFYTLDPEGKSPLTALLSWQSETGAFQTDFGDGPFDDFLSTVQSIPAAAGKAYPITGRFEAARQAVSCLSTIQDFETGGWEQFATFGVNAAGTSRAIQAITAVGGDPSSEEWTINGISAFQALEDLTPDYLAASRGGGVGIVMQGVVAAGGDVNDFAGIDLVLAMSDHLSPTGEYDDTSFGPFSHAEAMLGLLVSGETVDPTAIGWLLDAQDSGDWGGADSTGIALNVLGRLDVSVPEAFEVLQNTQEADGGWGFGTSNPNSSSEVVQGLVSTGGNPFDPSWSRVLSGTVMNAADAILTQQGEDGCWPNLFGPGEDPFGTTDAVLLLVQNPGWANINEMVLVEIMPVEETVTRETEPVATVEKTVVPTETPIVEETPTMLSTPTEEPLTTDTPQVRGDAPLEITPEPRQSESGDNNLSQILIVVVVVIVAIAGIVFWSRREK